MLRDAVRSILRQEYLGRIEVIVVYDQIELDALTDLDVPDARQLRTISNTRKPGLAGGRNSGILAARHDLVAFCDDDDEWMPSKLGRQVDAWAMEPDARLVATGMRVQTSGPWHDRLPPARAEFADFLESRITEIHPSSFLLRKDDLLGELGLVDEDLPASYGEDYDLLLRVSRLGHVLSVMEPLVLIHWNRTSFFSGRWEAIVDGLSYLLQKHPEFTRTPIGTSRIEGQVAFALAALGRRRQARSWATSALRHNRGQLRAYAAYAISTGVLPASWLVRTVNRRGRGL
ncbi:MAG: glycosyl transferase family 2 [Homoserinimonas sp.]|jgi:glycosyltransferase involved in cell wall biosynthesis|nr:glycosyl transferase family 2 [Homoserinimonas sp.]